MTDEQERADFEAWLGVKPCCGAGHDLAWEAWQARAALQSQDREGDDLKEVGKEELVEEVERLRDELDTIRVHSHHDIIDSDCFVCVSATEFEQVMNRVFGA